VAEYEVVVKSLTAVQVMSVRGIVPSPAEQGDLWRKLRLYLRERGIESNGPWISLYHNNENTEGDEEDVEVCAPVAFEVKPEGEVNVREIPAVETAATLVYSGPLAEILRGYAAMEQWIKASEYRVASRCRELYLRPPEKGSQTDPNAMVEIQFAVKKD
jgi:effector-binding domain-containing protein